MGKPKAEKGWPVEIGFPLSAFVWVANFWVLTGCVEEFFYRRARKAQSFLHVDKMVGPALT